MNRTKKGYLSAENAATKIFRKKNYHQISQDKQEFSNPEINL